MKVIVMLHTAQLMLKYEKYHQQLEVITQTGIQTRSSIKPDITYYIIPETES